MATDVTRVAFAVVTATGSSPTILQLDPQCDYKICHLATYTDLTDCLSTDEVYGEGEVEALTVMRDGSAELKKLAIPPRFTLDISGLSKLALQCGASVTKNVRLQVTRKLR